jgi:hypothetical protein
MVNLIRLIVVKGTGFSNKCLILFKIRPSMTTSKSGLITRNIRV